MANKGKKKISKAMKSVLESPKKVEKSVKAAEKYVNKTGGIFQFEREESKKTGEG